MKILQHLKHLLALYPTPILVTQNIRRCYFAIPFFLIPLFSIAQDEVLVEWNLAACKAFEDSDNYSEFTPDMPNSSPCVTASHVYRFNPTANQHSCAPGVDGTDGVAMCVQAEPWYLFFDNSEKAIRFEITLKGTATDPKSITSLNFYEKAADIAEQLHSTDLINNNYPRIYGVRITANGHEIFKEINIPTSTEWSLETFDFSQNPDFIVTELTVFNFELLAYFPIGNGHGATIWDIDNIHIIGNCDAVILPVELGDFTARAISKTQIALEWETLSEDGNKLFEIQRSTDGRTFKTIGSVNGNGTTDQTNKYNFIDKIPVPGINYYRLKQIDFDGDFEFSDVQSANIGLENKAKLIIYPNPIKDQTAIRLVNAPELDAKVQIINSLGQILNTSTLASGVFEKQIDLSAYKAGLYFIQVTYGDAQRVSHSVIKLEE